MNLGPNIRLSSYLVENYGEKQLDPDTDTEPERPNPFRMDWPDPIVPHWEVDDTPFSDWLKESDNKVEWRESGLLTWFQSNWSAKSGWSSEETWQFIQNSYQTLVQTLTPLCQTMGQWCQNGWQAFVEFYVRFDLNAKLQNKLTYNKCWHCNAPLEKFNQDSANSWRHKYCQQCWEEHRQSIVSEICAQIFGDES